MVVPRVKREEHRLTAVQEGVEHGDQHVLLAREEVIQAARV
jgi:hypothetical protein